MPFYLNLYDVCRSTTLENLLAQYINQRTEDALTQLQSAPPLKIFVLPSLRVGAQGPVILNYDFTFPARLPSGGPWHSAYLRAVIGYSGSGYQGHYWTWASRGQYWYRLDDTSVTRISATQVRTMTRQVYALISEDA